MRETLEKARKEGLAALENDLVDHARRLADAAIVLTEGVTEALALLDEMDRDHEANKKTIVELMIPIEALLMAYPEKDAKPIGMTQGVWDAIRKSMPIVRLAVLGREEERKAVLAILGKGESP